MARNETLTGGRIVGTVEAPTQPAAVLVEGSTNERGETTIGVIPPGSNVVHRMEPAVSVPAPLIRVRNMLRQPLAHSRGTAAGRVLDKATGIFADGEEFMTSEHEALALGKQVERV